MEVGEYVVDFMSIIGRGAFGTVYKGSHKATKEEVAVKQMPLSHDDVDAHDSYLHDIVQAEKEALKSLKDHPNIVRLLKFVLKDDAVYLIMEYCDLGPLNGYLKRNKELKLSSKLKIMIQATSAVAFMHAQKPPIIHRDLKLENILLRMTNGEVVVKVADFGLARLCDERQSGSMSSFANAQFTASVVGTRYFQAPELLREDEKTTYDSSVDVFALGLTCAVIFDFNPECTTLLPLSVGAKSCGKDVCFGSEMLECQKERKTLPEITKILLSDDAIVKDLKQLFLKMTAFRPKDRQQIRSAHAQLEKLFDRQQAKELVHKGDQPPQKDEEIPRLTAKLADQKAMSAQATASTTATPLSILTTKSFKKANEVKLNGDLYSLHVIGSELWCCCLIGVRIHDLDLRHVRTIPKADLGRVYSVAGLPDYTVAVAAEEGLFRLTTQGECIEKISDVSHNDVCVHSGRLYAMMSKEPCAVHVYSTDTWQRSSVIQHPCPYDSHYHFMRVNGQHIVLSCNMQNSIYKLSMEGQLITTYSKKGVFKEPMVTMLDSEGSVLITGHLLKNNNFSQSHYFLKFHPFSTLIATF